MITSSPNWAAIIYSNSQYSKKSSWSIYDGKVIQSNPLTLPPLPSFIQITVNIGCSWAVRNPTLTFLSLFFFFIFWIFYFFLNKFQNDGPVRCLVVTWFFTAENCVDRLLLSLPLKCGRCFYILFFFLFLFFHSVLLYNFTDIFLSIIPASYNSAALWCPVFTPSPIIKRCTPASTFEGLRPLSNYLPFHF